ncbi:MULTISPECIES: STAS domain-containing protein [unclassified Plantactinospora]|uniref:STAS domain-containing protein n=1 Tax=unclassified Plantactinospora TaxID=2631981 RepID=UPI00131F074A|nr:MULTISPECIES: STAS domain-containing protein [unclassified Plantactinospora]
MSEDDNAGDGGRRDGTATVSTIELAITGWLDHSAVPGVNTTFDAALDRKPERIVLDMAHCEYVDAAGIALLLDMHRQLRRTGGMLELRKPSARLSRLLEIARVDHVLRVDSPLRAQNDDDGSKAANGAHRPRA